MLFVEMDGKTYTVSQAATKLRCSRQAVMNRMRKGEFAYHDSGPYMRHRPRLSTTFLPGEVEALMERLAGLYSGSSAFLSGVARLRRLAAKSERLGKEGSR